MDAGRRLLLLLTLLAVPSSAVYAQRDLTEIPPPDPELERATFVLPPGFEVNLFAADPAIAKPIQMNFDTQGRLWIVSSETYPQIEPGKTANDKVLILDDADGDGVSDSTQIFAEGLLIPTGIEPGDGGAYVGASTELLHFRDHDGDGRADERRVVLSGFGTEDTHHIVHTLRWGPASLLYFNQSIYIHSHIETPWGVRRLNAGGIWEFRPESLELDVFARGLVNPWGTDFNRYGATFATDGAGGEGINYMVPGASYVTAYAARRILPGLNPGSPKHCGLEIVQSPHLPEDWQGSLLTNDFRGHRVCRFVLTEDGSGYDSQEQQEVIRSDHVAFRPVDVKMGPDGAIYIADWYNPIIQHGEVDFRDERRDHVHGRIWRVTYTGQPVVPRVDVSQLPTPKVLESLASENSWTRRSARRVLQERGPDALPALRRWIDQLPADGDDQLRLEALWVLQGWHFVDRELLATLLESSDGNVRAAATRVLGHWHASIDSSGDWLAERAQDEHPRVRLEAVRALARLKNLAAAESALKALQQDVDIWLDYALWQTVRELQPYWEPAVVEQNADFVEDARSLVFALRAAGSSSGIPTLLDMLEQGETGSASVSEIADIVAQVGRPVDRDRLLAIAASPKTEAAEAHQILMRMQANSSGNQARPTDPAAALANLLNHENPAVRSSAIELAGSWKVGPLREQINRLATSDDSRQGLRQAAIRALGRYADGAARQQLSGLARNAKDASIRQTAVLALLPLAPARAAEDAVALLTSFGPQDNAAPLFQAFLARKGGGQLLQKALAGKTLPSDVAVVGMRLVTSSGRDEPALIKALTDAGGVATGPVRLSDDEMKEMVGWVQQNGDPHIGEAIFRRKELACWKCHAIGDAGGKVGPNLLSLGATAQPDYIVESMLDPNAKLKEGYHTVIAATEQGQVFSGIQVRESDTDLILRDAEDRELSIPLNSIEERATGASLMPAGLTAQLTRPELGHLVSFLSALGRLPEFRVGTDPVVRRWDVLEATPQAAHALRRKSYAAVTTDDSAFRWNRTYSRVSGDLPIEELPELRVRNRVAAGSRGVSFVRFQLQSENGGKVVMQLNDESGLLQGWIDEQPIDMGSTLTFEIDPGVHNVVLVIDRAVRTKPLHVGLDREQSTGAVQIVAGK